MPVMLVVPTIWEAKIGRITVHYQLGQKLTPYLNKIRADLVILATWEEEGGKITV
jgi:hypothetical protein